MSDQIGILSFPLPAPSTANGDPAILVLCDFLKAVLNADCSAGWQILAPGRPVAKFALPIDIMRRPFVPENLPSLYVHRESGTDELWTSDTDKLTTKFIVRWVYPPFNFQNQVARDAFAHSVAASIRKAIYFGRHKSWIAPGDAANSSWWHATLPTPVAPETVMSSAAPIEPSRCFTVTTAASVGAYNTVDAIHIVGIDGFGNEIFDDVTLTAADGGETVSSVWRFVSITSIAIPAQVSTSGAMSFGYDVSPEASMGSCVGRWAGFGSANVSPAFQIKNVNVTIQEQKPVNYDLVEIDIMVDEYLTADPVEHSLGADGYEGTFVNADGFITETMEA